MTDIPLDTRDLFRATAYAVAEARMTGEAGQLALNFAAQAERLGPDAYLDIPGYVRSVGTLREAAWRWAESTPPFPSATHQLKSLNWGERAVRGALRLGGELADVGPYPDGREIGLAGLIQREAA